MSSIVSESKYIYGNLSGIDLNSGIDEKYICLDVSDFGLPYIDNNMSNDVRIQFFHKSYYSIIISLFLIDELIRKYDKEFLNYKLDRLFKYCSSFRCSIKNIDMLRNELIVSKNVYYDECVKYTNGMECGSLLGLNIFTVNLLRFMTLINDCFGYKENINIKINVDNSLSCLSMENIYELTRYKNVGLFVELFDKNIFMDNEFRKRKILDFRKKGY